MASSAQDFFVSNNQSKKNSNLFKNPMSPEPLISRAKALPAKRSEKGYGDENERIHVRAVKIIYGLGWYTPSNKVLVHANCYPLYNLYKFRLLPLAHKCSYGTPLVSIQQYFLHSGRWPLKLQ